MRLWALDSFLTQFFPAFHWSILIVETNVRVHSLPIVQTEVWCLLEKEWLSLDSYFSLLLRCWLWNWHILKCCELFGNNSIVFIGIGAVGLPSEFPPWPLFLVLDQKEMANFELKVQRRLTLTFWKMCQSNCQIFNCFFGTKFCSRFVLISSWIFCVTDSNLCISNWIFEITGFLSFEAQLAFPHWFFCSIFCFCFCGLLFLRVCCFCCFCSKVLRLGNCSAVIAG